MATEKPIPKNKRRGKYSARSLTKRQPGRRESKRCWTAPFFNETAPRLRRRVEYPIFSPHMVIRAVARVLHHEMCGK
jgi:hypothetical protein